MNNEIIYLRLNTYKYEIFDILTKGFFALSRNNLVTCCFSLFVHSAACSSSSPQRKLRVKKVFFLNCVRKENDNNNIM